MVAFGLASQERCRHLDKPGRESSYRANPGGSPCPQLTGIEPQRKAWAPTTPP